MQDDAIVATGGGLPKPSQQRSRIPLHLPRRSGCSGDGYRHGDEDRRSGSHREAGREDVPDEVDAAYSGRRLHYGRDYIIPAPFDPRLIVEDRPR